MSSLKVNIAGVEFENPVLTASGTFGSGLEYSEFFDLNRLGGITVKGVSYEPWLGNEPSRIAETYGGMLNSVGLQNEGVFKFIEGDLAFLKNYNTNIIVNVCGHSIEEYKKVVEVLNEEDIDMYELNISCPNISSGGITFGTDCVQVEKVVSEVKRISKKPLIVKLSPNVTDIVSIAKSAEYAGADGISLINTLIGMKIDINSRKTILKNKVGGLSGPCIKPIALRMVYQVAKAVDIPVIGMGGISNHEDAIEFIMAGATAVSIGTANFLNPFVTLEIIDGMKNYLSETKVEDINSLIGVVE